MALHRIRTEERVVDGVRRVWVTSALFGAVCWRPLTQRAWNTDFMEKRLEDRDNQVEKPASWVYGNACLAADSSIKLDRIKILRVDVRTGPLINSDGCWSREVRVQC